MFYKEVNAFYKMESCNYSNYNMAWMHLKWRSKVMEIMAELQTRHFMQVFSVGEINSIWHALCAEMQTAILHAKGKVKSRKA